MHIMILLIMLCLVVESNHYLSEYFPAIKGGVNKEGRSVGLRKSADQRLPMIEWLSDGTFALVEFEGERWVHIVYKKQKYAIPKKRFSLGYSKLYGLFTVPTRQYQRYQIWTSQHIRWFHFGLVFSIILLVIVRRKQNNVNRTKPKPNRNNQIIQRQPLIAHEQPITKTYVTDPVDSQRATIVLGPTLTDQQKDDIKQNLIKELYKSKKFLEALNAEYRGRIEEMENAANRMREEFEEKKEDAKVLGVDLDSSKLPALVKGRLFEIFAAKIWDADSRATIQSWTPDKGINEGINIKSNGEPDFLLELKRDTESTLMAIECKYRSIYKPQGNNEKIIQWVKYYQYKRYEQYQECTGRNVYMLLGVGGDPKSPDNLYFGPLSKLKSKSSFDDREDFKNLFAVQEALEPFKVKSLTMMDSLFSCLDD
jgi:hypothetical protein